MSVFSLHETLPDALLLDRDLSGLSWTINTHTEDTQTYDGKPEEDFPTLPAPTLIPLTDNEQQIKASEMRPQLTVCHNAVLN